MVNEQLHRVRKTFEAERRGLFAFIHSKLRSLEESEDLLQDVFFQALTNLNVLEAVDNLTAWLYTVAKNKIVDRYRRKKLPTMSIEESLENGFGFENLLAQEMPESMPDEDREKVFQSIMKAIDELGDKQRHVFIRQVVEGRTFRELAQETGESINTLIARKRYAIQFLRDRLKHEL